MLGNISQSVSTETLMRNLGELYLGQARTEREKGNLDATLPLYNQVKDTLKSLGSVKEALRKAQVSHTLADETLRKMMADAYFERGEVLEGLNLFSKARSSYLKAEMWGHDEAKQYHAEAVQLPPSGDSTHSRWASVRSAIPSLMAVQKKSDLVEYLFEKVLSALGPLKVPNKSGYFLVYAHDDTAQGKVETSKYLIDRLCQIGGVKLHSDQARMGRLYLSSQGDLKDDRKLEDIVTDQLSLLPAQLIQDVKPVGTVVVCCSELLGNYLKDWPDYKKYYGELREAYDKDLEAYSKDSEQKDASAICKVVSEFAEGPKYKAGFHHVLTEIAFLKIRAEHPKDPHGIIPVLLTPNSYKDCLADFIPESTFRVEDIPSLEGPVKNDEEVYPNQSRHGVLFKLLKLLLVASDEANTLLDKFWREYSGFISRLKDGSTVGGLEFAQLLDSIFNKSVHEKGVLVDYMFDKALLTLSSLEVSKKPRLFLVYAHDNPDSVHGDAKASTSKYLINKLSHIRGVTLYSDQTPTGQPYSNSDENLKEDGKLEDILTNQLCLLPHQLREDVKPVDKVIVCCSDVLGSYLKGRPKEQYKGQYYKEFCDALKKAYDKDREAYVKDGKQKGTPALREVVRTFSQEEKYRSEFHHVLTEMAFLEIRAVHLKGQHGIIPVSLTPNSYDYCLKDFIDSTTVRMEDPLRFDLQAQKGEEVYLNQGSHGVLFKVIERLLAGSNEAKTFLDKFWTGHSHVISRLKSDPNFGKLEFAKLLDGIFDDIRTTLHKQLASTVQQEYEQLQVYRADPRAALKEQYLAALKLDKAFEQILQLYVEPRGKAKLYEGGTGTNSDNNSDSVNNSSGLLPQVEALLKDKKVILLTGDSGAGKTLFNRRLEKHLWEHKKEADAIPLFISLPSIEKPEQDLIAKALKKRGLSEFQIQKLKKDDKQRFVFILDGYDEIRQTQNLYVSNALNQSDGWQGHMVISCRSEYLGQDYQSRFQPNPIQQDKDTAFQEVVVEPFSKEESDQYLEKYVAHNPTGWTAQAYQEAFSQQSNLKDLISNPFLLRVVLEALPDVEKKGEAVSAIQLRLDLYDQFVRSWFERNQQRLSNQSLTGTKKEVFSVLSDEGFAKHGIAFVQALAVQVYIENAGKPIVDYSSLNDKGNWKDAFFDRKEENQLLRDAWPLIRSGTEYRFIHKSVLEYFVARSLFESFDGCVDVSARQRRGSSASVYSFEERAVLPPKMQRDVSLSPKHWIGDLGVVRLLTDRVWQEPKFKEQLLAIIERSKADKSVRQTAANAITILVRAGVPFHRADLKGIQIPGADLSFGFFDSAQLQGADLRKTTLRTSWLRQANLSGAQMAGVQFGEWAYLQEESDVNSCAYSPDGKTCAIGLGNGKICVYATSNWKEMHTLTGHSYGVSSVVYSPSGLQIASGSEDHTVRVWDAQSGASVHILTGHTSYVSSVVYSPSGLQIASGSGDYTVRVWDADSGAAGHTLTGHTDKVYSVVYSPSGLQIASGSWDETVRVWEAQSGASVYLLRGHTSIVTSVVYSPSGLQIASGSHDETVRVWDAHSGAAVHTLRGHTNIVTSVVYSPSGAQLASGSYDKTVRVWDAQSGASEHTLTGHSYGVSSVVYSPSGLQIASGSEDRTMRLWDAQSGAVVHTLTGHTDKVYSVVYSPSGLQIASGSEDHTVRVWDAQSGASVHILTGHTSYVSSVVYSPSGLQIASGSGDYTVRVWDADSGAAGHTLTGHTDKVYSVVYSPSGLQIASGSWDETVRVWEAQSGASVYLLRGHTSIVTSVVYSPSGLQIASGSHDETVRVWDAHSGAAVHTLRGHTKLVSSVVYSPSGLQIASGSEDHTVRVWDAQSGASEHTLTGHTDSVSSVVYSPSGLQIASGSDDQTVRVWDVQSGASEHTLRGHTSYVSSVVYSPSGLQVASGSLDRTVRVWDAQSGASEHTLRGHTKLVSSVVYSPSGLQIASGSSDKTVRLWEVASGHCLSVIQSWSGVTSVAWTGLNGHNYLVSGGKDGSVGQWKLKKDPEKGYQALLCWSVPRHKELMVKDTVIEAAHGLSEVNRALLTQRGAQEGGAE